MHYTVCTAPLQSAWFGKFLKAVDPRNKNFPLLRRGGVTTIFHVWILLFSCSYTKSGHVNILFLLFLCLFFFFVCLFLLTTVIISYAFNFVLTIQIQLLWVGLSKKIPAQSQWLGHWSGIHRQNNNVIEIVLVFLLLILDIYHYLFVDFDYVIPWWVAD